MRGMYVDRDGKEIGVLQWRWWQCGCKDAREARARGQWHGARPAQARKGRCNDGVAKEVMGERENS
jgi:hypothetical protein